MKWSVETGLEAISDFSVEAVAEQPVVPDLCVVVCIELINPAELHAPVLAIKPTEQHVSRCDRVGNGDVIPAG